MLNQSSIQLFLFPHQDDEFGVFHLLDENVREGRRSICIFLTNGVSGSATAVQRNAESLQVLSGCGIPKQDIRFLGTELAVADGRLIDDLDRLFDATMQIAVRNAVTSIFVPAWEGGHPDHDASVLLGRALAGAIGSQVVLQQFALYNAYRTTLVPFRVLFPLPENGSPSLLPVPRRARMKHLGRCLKYTSQWKTWTVLLPAVALKYQSYPEQALQPVLDERLRLKPHEGALLYERRGWSTWEEEMGKSERFRQRHSLVT